LPGYTGFLPESYANARAVSQAEDHTSADQKNCRLFTLHQLRNFMPGTSIFEPRDAANLMEGPKGRAGTSSAFNVSCGHFGIVRMSFFLYLTMFACVRMPTCRAPRIWLSSRTIDPSKSITAAKMARPPSSSREPSQYPRMVSRMPRATTAFCALLKACRVCCILPRLPKAGMRVEKNDLRTCTAAGPHPVLVLERSRP
jgi:hypothetical protein